VAIAIYLVILVAAFYFLIVRPQRRQQMIRRHLISSVGVGDEIITNGGVFGVVRSLDPDTLDLEIAPGVVVKVARAAVAQRVAPVTEETYDGEGADAPDDADDADGGDGTR
jgi:preprotein translocase subunit YajC